MPNTVVLESDLQEDEALSLYERDECSRAHGISVEEVRPGYSRLTMPVRKDMISGNAICHGGITFMLADTAAAYVANTSNHISLGMTADIHWIAPVRLGNVLTAECRAAYQEGKTVMLDVTVTTDTGATVALFRVRGKRIQAVAGCGSKDFGQQN